MASFTDNLQYLTAFTPYIQQQPVETMAKVGMAKQEQYNQGIQKIQSSIDSIAGLDIAKDSDKAYLQSKINELGNNLKFVAAGDFSDFQLVNSVNGMTSQLVKDQNVVNAVSSTAKLRKEQAFMEKQRQEGKSSPANEWDFNIKASSWLNSSEIGESFNGRYTPYTDVQKKYLEIFKSLHSDLVEQDIPYVMENGKPNYEKTAAAMQRLSKESVSKEKIENALRASLTPVELEQLSIDGRYTFQNYTPDQIATASVRGYNESIKSNEEKIKQLQGFTALTGKALLRKQAEETIKEYEQNNLKLAEQVKEETEYALSNPEAAKIMLYKNSSIQQFAAGNAWEHNKSNVLVNPVKTQENWEREFAMAQTKMNHDISNESWDRKMDILNYNLNSKKIDAEEKKAQEKEKGKLSTFTNFFGADSEIGDPWLSAKTSLDDIKASGDAIYNNIIKNSKKPISREQIREAVSAYNKGNKTKYKEAISVIDPIYHKDIEKLARLRIDIKVATAAFTTSENIANNSQEVIKLQTELNNNLKGLGNYTISTAKGPVTFTPQEMAIFIGKKNTRTQGISVPYGTNVISETRTTYTGDLSPKEKLLAQHIPNIAETNGYNKFVGAIQTSATKLISKKNEIKYKKFNELNQKWIPKLSSITVGSGDDDTSREFYEGMATSLISAYDKTVSGQSGGNQYSTKEELSDLQEIIGSADKAYLEYKVLQKGDEKILIVQKGSKTYQMPMTQNEWSQLPMDLDTKYQEVLNAQKAQGGTTNMSGLFEDAWYTKKNFPMTSLNVKADLRTGDGVTQFPTLRVGTDAGVAVIDIPSAFASPEAAEFAFANLTDADIISAIINSDNESVSPEIKALFKK